MGNRDAGSGVYIIASIISRVIAVFLDSISLLPHLCHLVLSCFASLDTLVPRVLMVCVDSTPAVSEPRTATCTTTEFARFRDGATCETHGTNGRCRCGWCLYVGNGRQ